MGTTYADIFKMAGGIRDGGTLKAFAPSGPSFGIYPASMADIKLDFKSSVELPPIGHLPKIQLGTLGSGAIIAIAEPTCVLDLALNFVRFFRNESCGKCVPCRVGSQKMADLIEAMTQGRMMRGPLGASAGIDTEGTASVSYRGGGEDFLS